MSDGPNGVRGSRFDERVSAWCTPCGTGLAASWDPALVEQVGQLLGDEARRMGVDVLLGPMVNLPRSPLGGRAFECLSEDPLLTGRLAAAYITGVQSRGVAATVKHLVANDAETHRTTVDCVIDERALRELYLVPFEYAARAGVWTVMASYNRVNGVHATEHRGLLVDLLRHEWGWDGLVMSDWGAAHDTVACARAGLDLEMPVGPTYGPALAAAVEAGAVSEEQLDEKVDRLVQLARRIRAARGRRPQTVPDRAAPALEQPRLLGRAAAAGFVLLKNEGDLLPLQLERDHGPLAVIGPNVHDPTFQGGGSAWVNTGALDDPLTLLTERFGHLVEVRHVPGCTARTSYLPLELHDVRATGPSSAPGLTVTYLPDPASPAGRVDELRGRSFLSWHDGIDAFRGGPPGEVRMAGWLIPARDGDHTFSVKGSGPSDLFVDGVHVAELGPQGDPSDAYAAFFSHEIGVGTIRLTAGRPVLVEARMKPEPVGIPLFEVGCRAPEAADLLRDAVRLAEVAQAVVLVVGTSTDVEAESIDRTTTALPGDQDALVEAVLDANPRTVVVVNAGGQVDLPWIARAAAVLYVWFPGHGFAEALAAVLSGDAEPGGRLPLTLARSPGQYAAYDTRPDAANRLVYSESVFMGYRHVDAHGLEPAFPFGHGLGYTRFGYQGVSVSGAVDRAGGPVSVSVTLTNTGRRPGKEVVQLYVSPPASAVARPPRELKAFAPIWLTPGETTTVTFELGSRAFAHWDAVAHSWQVIAGDYGIHVGRSSRDLPLVATVQREGEDLSNGSNPTLD